MKKISLVLIVLLIASVGFGRTIRGSGKVIKEERSVKDFDSLVFGCTGDLELIQGSKESLVIEAEDNIMPLIETKVRGGTLKIRFNKYKSHDRIKPTRKIKFTVTLVNIKDIHLSGSGDIWSKKIKSEELNLNISGSGEIDLGEVSSGDTELTLSGSGRITIDDLDAKDIDAKISGSGDFNLSGKAKNQVVVITGSGDYNASDLVSEYAELKVSGSGDVEIRAEERLDVRISGSGDVDYYGDPDLDSKVSGSGNLRRKR